jgi:O-antigen/teichoic acid export membrane protein
MLLTNIPVGLASLIVPLLSLFFASIMVGYFSFAFIFYFAALLIPNSLSIVLFPKISELNGLKKHTDAKNFLKRTFVIYTPIVLIGILIVILFSEQIINLISKEYLPSLFMFKVLISLGLIFGYNIIYTNYLRGLGRIKLFALLTLIQNLLLIAISFIIITT